MDENEDVLRLMTIHQAKGLEFPIVVAADLGWHAKLEIQLPTASTVFCYPTPSAAATTSCPIR